MVHSSNQPLPTWERFFYGLTSLLMAMHKAGPCSSPTMVMITCSVQGGTAGTSDDFLMELNGASGSTMAAAVVTLKGDGQPN